MKDPKKPCVSCGREVRERQPAPYPGHAKDCDLVAEWRRRDKSRDEVEARYREEASE